MQLDPQDDTVVLEGAISVEAALKSGSRDIDEILVRPGKDEHTLARLERLAQSRGVKVRRVVDAAEIDERASGTSHGGVIAIAGPRKFVALDVLTHPASFLGTPPETGREGVKNSRWVVMIDGVEDPYNFGSAVRSAYAAGASGLVVRPRNWFTAAGLIARASAGATESISTAIAETAEAAAEVFRARGFVVACADETPEAVSLYDADLTRPLFLLIGGEKRGITRSFRDHADLTLRIPYGTASTNSLGTAAATAVISFEILRQRLAGSPPATRPAPRPSQRTLLPPPRRRR